MLEYDDFWLHTLNIVVWYFVFCTIDLWFCNFVYRLIPQPLLSMRIFSVVLLLLLILVFLFLIIILALFFEDDISLVFGYW